MNYKDKKWHDFQISYLKTFGKDVPIFTPSIFREYRGEIYTTYCPQHPANNLFFPFDIEELNVHNRFSKSYQGVLRGLHWDTKTWKLVQAVAGDIYLVVLDMRAKSVSSGKWESYILSEKTHDQILIPPYFANGHYALTDCLFHYTLFYQGSFVTEKEQKVVKWNDPQYNIEWPTNNPVLQNRDR